MEHWRKTSLLVILVLVWVGPFCEAFGEESFQIMRRLV